MALRTKLTNAGYIYTGEKTVCGPPDDTGLSGLSISPGDLTPVFENCDSDHEQPSTPWSPMTPPRPPSPSLHETPTLKSSPATPTTCPSMTTTQMRDGWQVKLRSYRTTFQWTVRSANGASTMYYTLVVFRPLPPASEARLHSLELSRVRLAETFDTDTQTYMATTTAEKTTVTTPPLDRPAPQR